MSKLSTEKIKALMTQWLKNSDFMEGYDEEHILANLAEFSKLKSSWENPSKWRRIRKSKLGDDYKNYFKVDDRSGNVSFFKDAFGEADDQLAEEYFNEPDLAEKCILREFLPEDPLDDAFRLEVVTTPEDDIVIGWVIIVD